MTHKILDYPSFHMTLHMNTIIFLGNFTKYALIYVLCGEYVVQIVN
jgi:hypothetical protein